MHISLGRACRSAFVLCGVITAIAPAAALASTYTVDDDKQDCPNASFTSIQAAVNQAAPHDTIVVCPGTYLESSTPNSNAASFAQTGSHNGLTITKPLNIVGAGASKVFIMPNPAAVTGNTLAGTVPYLRDGGGNVITVSRQSLGSTDQDDTVVNISGVTIESPTVYAEAGVAFFNASGSIENSVVGPLASAASIGSNTTLSPDGYGVVATNSLQGAGTGTARREVDISNSLISGYQAGGLYFDDSIAAPDSAPGTTRSGIIQYANVDHTRIAGSLTSPLAQVGATYRSGQRGVLNNDEITGNSGKGILLADADTSASDPNVPGVPSFSMNGDNITANGTGYGTALFNAQIDGVTISNGAPALANGTDGTGANWFGCPDGPVVTPVTTGNNQTPANCQKISGANTNSPPTASVTYVPLRQQPLPLVAPGVTTDAAPKASVVNPGANATVVAGTDTKPVVAASDDFGVKSVDLTAGGVDLGVVGHTPYEYSWTPTSAQIGSTIPLTATVTDSSGQTTTSTINVTVAGPAGYQPITVDQTALAFGSLTVGTSTTKTITVTDSGLNALALTGFDVAGSGFAVSGGTCTTSTVLAPGSSCTVTVAFAPVAAAAHAGYLKVVSYAPGVTGPTTIALTGTGLAKPVVPPVPPKLSTLKLDKTAKAKGSKLTVGKITCTKAAAASCTVTETGTLKVGKASFKLSLKTKVTGGKTATLTLKLSKKAQSALKKRKGTLKLTTKVVGSTGAKSSTTSTLSIKKGA